VGGFFASSAKNTNLRTTVLRLTARTFAIRRKRHARSV
jgi:hypothetical protein